MNEILRIRGGEKLEGEVLVSGSKNSVLPILAASLVVKGRFFLRNVPNITDVYFMISLLEKLGIEVSWLPNNTLFLRNNGLKSNDIRYSYANEVRSSVLLLAGVLNKFGSASIMLPGGDKIGPRPINYHLAFFKKLGFEYKIHEGYVEVHKVKSEPKKLRLRFPFPSVGATQQSIIYSSSSNITVNLENCAVEPEIIDLIHFLKGCGADIEVINRTIKIKGKELLANDYVFDLPGDRIEFLTFTLLGALIGRKVTVSGVQRWRVNNVLKKLQKLGVQIKSVDDQSIEIKETRKLNNFRIVASPYPGFPTDLQPMMAVLGSKVESRGVLKDNVFPTRFAYLEELKKFGINYKFLKNGCMILRSTNLIPAQVRALDIRTGAALVLAGLTAKGESEILDSYHLRRGYDSIDIKIRNLGGSIYFIDTALDEIKIF